MALKGRPAGDRTKVPLRACPPARTFAAMHAAARRSSTAPLAARIRALGARVRAELSWNRIYRASSYARSALWIVPIVAIFLVLLLAPLLRALDAAFAWRLLGLD